MDIFVHEKVDTQLIILEFKARDEERLALSQKSSLGNGVKGKQSLRHSMA